MTQVEVHNKIEQVIKLGPKVAEVESISVLINTNEDSTEYFFSKANEHWLEWLWKNGFLEKLNEKSINKDSYNYRMAELNYLSRIVEIKPEIVTNIILATPITIDNYNPEVIDQYVRFCSNLPADFLIKIVKKINSDNWVKLMGKFTQYGFDYKDILETLYTTKNYESILILAETLLQLREKDNIISQKTNYRSDNPFFITDISESKIFNILISVPEEYQEQSFNILIPIFKELSITESEYSLIDENLFELKLNDVGTGSYKEEFKLIVASILEISRKVISKQSTDYQMFYSTYIRQLPDNQVCRRLKLFVLCLKPVYFKKELETEYFKLFSTKKIEKIISGAEYEESLKIGFKYLGNHKKREFVKKVFELFNTSKNDYEKSWGTHYASCILSSIYNELDDKEKELALSKGYRLDPNYQPEPTIGKVRSGSVNPKSPIKSEEFKTYTINEIVTKLKNELSPNELKKSYKNEDFLNPINAEGVAEQLKIDIKQRPEEYLNNALLFFDRDGVSPHYTNEFLSTIKDILFELKNDNESLYDPLLKLLLRIKESGATNQFFKADVEETYSWISSWRSVHLTIADLLEELLKQKDNKTIINFTQYRSVLLEIITYLFDYEDPIPEDEQLKTAKSKVKDSDVSEYLISDPFTIAINSVRGKTFQTFLQFIYQEYKKNNKVTEDIKNLYIKILTKENTRAISFMFGYYLYYFYFRDPAWVRKIFSEIFNSNIKSEFLNLATWEGYLSNNLYYELFSEKYIQELYEKNISIDLKYPDQKFFKDPKESIAVHLALAFSYYEDYSENSKLISKFLNNASEIQLSEFISYIGKSVINNNQPEVTDKKYVWRINRLKKLWDYFLEKKPDSEALKEFGNWIESEKIFDIEWLSTRLVKTLELTGGKLSWDFELTQEIEKIASSCPKNAILIIRSHFMGIIKNNNQLFPLREDKEWYTSFKILYDKKEVREDTYKLIAELIEKGGRPFWSLEEIVKNVKD